MLALPAVEKRPKLVVELLGGAQPRHVGGQGQHVAEGGRAPRTLDAGRLTEGAIAGGEAELIDLRVGECRQAAVDVHVIGEPERVRLLGHAGETAHRRRAERMAGAVGAFLEQSQQGHLRLRGDDAAACMPRRSGCGDAREADATDGRRR